MRKQFENGLPLVLAHANPGGANDNLAAICRTEDMLRVLIDMVPAMIVYLDTRQRYVFCNKPYLELVQLREDQILGRSVHEIVGDQPHKWMQPWLADASAGRKVRFERRHQHSDGTTIELEVTLAPHFGPDAKVIGSFALILDITERKQAEAALRESDARNHVIPDAFPALMAYVDKDEIYRFANRTCEKWFGRDNGLVVGRSVREVFGNEAAYFFVTPYVDLALSGQTVTYERESISNGRTYVLQCTYVPHLGSDLQVLGFYELATDITSLKRIEQRLEHMAQHDPLTGLPNRTLFHYRLTQSIERCRRNKLSFAVMFLDIDHFKTINDTFGHNAGDQLLKSFADRLASCIRASDMAARLGGDEFAVILEEIAKPEHAAGVARKVLDAMRTAFELGEIKVLVTTSIGIAIVDGNAAHTSLKDLLADADMALYEAKAGGRSTFRIAEACGVA